MGLPRIVAASEPLCQLPLCLCTARWCVVPSRGCLSLVAGLRGSCFRAASDSDPALRVGVKKLVCLRASWPEKKTTTALNEALDVPSNSTSPRCIHFRPHLWVTVEETAQKRLPADAYAAGRKEGTSRRRRRGAIHRRRAVKRTAAAPLVQARRHRRSIVSARAAAARLGRRKNR